jgi:hypothetical protein
VSVKNKILVLVKKLGLGWSKLGDKGLEGMVRWFEILGF